MASSAHADALEGGGHAAAGYLSQLIGGLALVIVAILVFAWFLRRLSGGATQGRQVIDVLAVKPLGMRERLVLVQVGGDQILLAMTPAGIRHLHTLTQAVDPGLCAESATVDFAALLRRFGGKGLGG
ncbi:flagellar biosynthetic protein FliO [Thiorhodococcus fuscus]|uniref:Flagellar protein n=1 Tax=Thiorhodococcus fuscus TaxID=527200 RepID=A0ABW4YA26_9GAMM